MDTALEHDDDDDDDVRCVILNVSALAVANRDLTATWKPRSSAIVCHYND